MKTLKFAIIGMLIFLSGAAQGQVSVNVNIGSPPMWGPVGYTEAHYYYIPDIEAYYDVQTSMFIYFDEGVWIHRAYLPNRYRNYDLYGGYKVVMHDYHGNTPYVHFNEYKKKYAKGYRGQAQKTIGTKPGKENSRAQEPGKKVNTNNTKSADRPHNKEKSQGNNKNQKNDKKQGGGKKK